MGSMGSTQSRHEESVQKEAYEDVHVSDDVLQRFRDPSNSSQRTPKRSLSSSDQSLSVPENSSETKENDVVSLDKENERLRTSLQEAEAKTVRLKQELNRNEGIVESLRSRVDFLENKLTQSSVAVPQIAEKVDKRNTLISDSFYRKKLDELAISEDEIRQQKAKELQENVERLQKRLISEQMVKDGVCAEEEAKLFKCYLDNRKNSLKCRDLGEDFIKCVEDYRNRMTHKA